MKLQAVIFDYGNVICRPPTEQQISEAAALCGITVDEFLDAFWRKRREYDRGIDAREYWKDFADYIGRDFDDALLNDLMRREIEFWTGGGPSVYGGIRHIGVTLGASPLATTCLRSSRYCSESPRPMMSQGLCSIS